MQRYDFRDELGALALPVLLLAGSGDGDVAQEFRSIAARYPHVRCELIEGAGHLPNVQAAGRFNSILGEFLASTATLER